jgi:hypothetical protein
VQSKEEGVGEGEKLSGHERKAIQTFGKKGNEERRASARRKLDEIPA